MKIANTRYKVNKANAFIVVCVLCTLIARIALENILANYMVAKGFKLLDIAHMYAHLGDLTSSQVLQMQSNKFHTSKYSGILCPPTHK